MKFPIGTRVVVIRGGHKELTATVVECPDVDLSLCCGDVPVDSFSLKTLRSDPLEKRVYIKFDDESIKGGDWGSGAFFYSPRKLRKLDADE